MKINRPIFKLSEDEKFILVRHFSENNMGYDDAAKKIGITKPQLYFPIRGIRNCSRQSYQKIQKFIKKIERLNRDSVAV